MNAGIEGSLILDGLIEGRLPDEPGFEVRLRDWARDAQRLGLGLDLEVEGRTFSLLADHMTLRAERLGVDPEKRIREVLEELTRLFADPAGAELFSTLRSVEYAPGEEIQTVYLIRPDGSVEAPRRSLTADTTPPVAPPSSRDWIRVAFVGLAVLALVFGITSLFVDWGEQVRSLWHKVTPLDVEGVEVDGSRFAEFLTISKKERGAGSRSVDLTLVRTEAYPGDDDALGRALAEEGLSFRRRLALEALARGYVRFEVFAEDGQFLGSVLLRIQDLREEDPVVVKVPVPRDPRPGKVVLTW